MIVKEGDDWILKSSDGSKVLGRHKTKEEALAQERAVQAQKHDQEESEPSIFEIGDRVRVRSGREHMPEHRGVAGTVREVRGDTYAIMFDGTTEMHRWYTGDELEPSATKADSSERVRRFDRSEPLKPAQRMPNGWLRVDGRLARTGVQVYRDAAGNERRELRLPEEVFDRASMDSFSLLPLTDSHPPVMLDAKNAKQFAVGSVGTPRRDGEYMRADILITDEAAIKSAERGKLQLSNGYSCILDDTQDPSLTAKYGRYDAIQRGIAGNHCALVMEGRAGPEARIRLDGTDAECMDGFADNDSVVKDSIITNVDKPKESMKMHALKVDGMTFEVNDPNAQTVVDKALAAVRKDADDRVAAEKAKIDAEAKAKAEALKALAEVQGKLDALVEKNKSDAEKMMKCDECNASGDCKACGGKGEYPMKNMDAAFIYAKVDRLADRRAGAKAVLYTTAAEYLGKNEKLDSKSDLEIKALVVKKLNPKANLDGRTPEYVNAAYDLAIESAPKPAEQARANATVLVLDPARSDGKPNDPEQARQQMISRTLAAFKK